jgi:prepilin-type N-terminal cleavage/methylation domain-containing protein
MNNKGFTLVELLATIVIISVVAVISVPTIGNIISDMSNKVYIESEKTLARTGQNYFLTNNELLPIELGESSFIKLDQLVAVAAAEKIIDPKDQQECEGYLIVSKPTANSYEYEPYIKCGTNYSTPLYDMESAMEPNILILGANPFDLLVGEAYIDEGAKARDKYGNNITSQIIVDNQVNTNVIGSYQVLYSVTDADGVSKTVSRIVNVIDTIPPVITLTAPVPPAFYTLYQDGMFNEPGYIATDNSDGTITARVQVTHDIAPGLPGNYTVTYTVADDSGNIDTKTRNVTVVADPAPTVLFGTNGNATWGTSRSTTVTVSDVGSGIDTSSLEYQWTTSTSAPTEVSFVTPFTNGATITSPAGVSGAYYLWILAKDNNNHTTITRSNVFNLDIINPTLVFGTNGNATYAKTRSTTVTVSDTVSGVNTSSLEYQWTTSTSAPTEVSFVTPFTNGATITSPAGVSGTYYLWILAKDNASNTIILRSNLFNLDNDSPVITITGTNPITIYPGTYTDSGATAIDAIDGVLTSSINTTSNVTPSVIGSYEVTYTVTDSSGNIASSIRTVNVVSPDVNYIIVAGGGGGGRTLWYAGGGGGGGAGGVLTGTRTTTAGSYAIVVGAGGAAGATEGANGSQGGSSSAFGFTATGGGRGGAGVGGTGGSGGGGGNTGASGTVAGGSGTSGQGNAGGYGIGAEDYAVKGAGGGGGASAGGTFSNAVSYRSGHGGTGIQWLNGSWYAGGGSGGHWGGVGTSGNGGSGIGGKGGINNGPVHATAPVANTGSGGGGGCGGATASAGAAGVVIIRYQGSPMATGGTITSSGGYTYHTFTASGTFVVN